MVMDGGVPPAHSLHHIAQGAHLCTLFCKRNYKHLRDDAINSIKIFFCCFFLKFLAVRKPFKVFFCLADYSMVTETLGDRRVGSVCMADLEIQAEQRGRVGDILTLPVSLGFQ